MKALATVLVGLLVLAGCGGDDDGDGGEGNGAKAPTTTVPETPIPTGLSGEDKEVADAAAGLLEARSGEDACFELLGADYVESLGGEDACAKALDPLVTGNFDRVASVRVVKPETQAFADVSGRSGRHVTIRFAKASTGDWNMDAASGLPR
jgi:hypothetical protein